MLRTGSVNVEPLINAAKKKIGEKNALEYQTVNSQIESKINIKLLTLNIKKLGLLSTNHVLSSLLLIL